MTKQQHKQKRTTHRGAHNQQEETNSLLKQMLHVQKQLTLKELPSVNDVNKIVMKRHKIHTYQRTISLGNIVPSGTVETDGAFNVSLSQLPDSTEFTTLYDTYRIMQLAFEFYPLFVDTTATTPYPPIATAIDYDDATATTYSVLQEYDSFQLCQTGQYFERIVTPRMALAGYSGSFTSYAQAHAGQWLDCGSPGIIHYGLKYAIPISGAANAVWSVSVHVIVQFRESR